MNWRAGVLLVLGVAVAAGVAVPGVAEAAEPPPRILRYDLQTGDRLVYRETLSREREGRGSRFVVEAEWTSEVLVVGEGHQGAVVGIQRRRRRAELVRAGGGDALARARSDFAERLARRPKAIAAADVYDDRGQGLLAPQVDREWPSDLLPFVHEIEALPAAAVAPGSEWRDTHPLGLEFRAEGPEDVDGEICRLLRGHLPGDQVVLGLWFSLESSVLRRVELKGWYPWGGGGKVREELRFELLERHRGESLDAWLDAPERRLGVLAALLLADGLPVDGERIRSLLTPDDAELRRAALRLLWRRRLPVAAEVLAPLLESSDPRVRALATRALEPAPAEEARPLLETALVDPDVFVRDAARQWFETRLPSGRLDVDDPAQVAEAWSLVRPAPPARAGHLTSIASTVREGDVVSSWGCDSPGWSEQALLQQRLPPELPGARLQVMASEKWRGQPYVVRVPDEYRGDHPVPLLVYLSGGRSTALLGWATAATALAPTGYLAVFPQASGMWWSEESEELVRLLIQEILGRFSVDTNRVYLAGFSNGGTGTYVYAARWADRLAAAVSLEGAGKRVGFGVSVPPPGGVGRLPFLLAHGDEDRVITVLASRESAELLKRENRDARVELVILPGRGHDLMLGTDGGLTLEFLERHRREPFPRQVAFALGDLRTPRRYWIEVLDKKRGVARVEGVIGDDGIISLKTERVKRLRLLLRRELLPGAEEVRVLLNGREAFRGPPVEDCALLQRSWHATRDPFMAHSMEVPLQVR